jgi:hypothetical protein
MEGKPEERMGTEEKGRWEEDWMREWDEEKIGRKKKGRV